MRTEEDRRRIRSTIQLAARMVEMRERGQKAQIATKVRVARLDPKGNPTGEIYDAGPLLITGEILERR